MLGPAPLEAQSFSAPAGPRKASFRKKSTLAKMQLKCTDSTPLCASKVLFNVSFVAGNLPERATACGHDFTAEPLCSAGNALWDLRDAETDLDGQCLVVRALITPVFVDAEIPRGLDDDQHSAGGELCVDFPAATIVYQ